MNFPVGLTRRNAAWKAQSVFTRPKSLKQSTGNLTTVAARKRLRLLWGSGSLWTRFWRSAARFLGGLLACFCQQIRFCLGRAGRATKSSAARPERPLRAARGAKSRVETPNPTQISHPTRVLVRAAARKNPRTRPTWRAVFSRSTVVTP